MPAAGCLRGLIGSPDNGLRRSCRRGPFCCRCGQVLLQSRPGCRKRILIGRTSGASHTNCLVSSYSGNVQYVSRRQMVSPLSQVPKIGGKRIGIYGARRARHRDVHHQIRCPGRFRRSGECQMSTRLQSADSVQSISSTELLTKFADHAEDVQDRGWSSHRKRSVRIASRSATSVAPSPRPAVLSKYWFRTECPNLQSA